MSALDLQQARNAAQAAARASASFHSQYDLFVCPAVTSPPARIGELALKGYERAGLALLRTAPAGAVLRRVAEALADAFLERTPNTQLFNQTGQPAISLPLHTDRDGLPVGVQLAAAVGREDLLIRVAAQLEAAHPSSGRTPRTIAAGSEDPALPRLKAPPPTR